MAAVNFPNSPTVNDTHTSGGSTWKWDGTVWQRVGTPGAQGAQGAQGHQGHQGRQGTVGAQGATNALTIAVSPPGSPSAGDLWWDSDDGDLHTYFNDGNSSQWVNINNGPAGAQGAQGVQGAQGHQGHQGVQGAGGAGGSTGAQGHQGHQGVQGAVGVTVANNADNRVITGGSGTNLNGEANLTFNGTSLGINDSSGNARFIVKGNSDTSDGDCQIRIYDTDTTAGSQIPSLSFWGGSTELGRIRGTDTDGMKFYAYNGSGLTDSLTLGTGGNRTTIGISTTLNMVTNSEVLSVRGYSSFKSTSKDYAALYLANEGNTTNNVNALILFNQGGANRGGIGYVPNTGELRFNNQYYLSFNTGSSGLGGTEKMRITADGTCHLAYQGGNTNAQKVKITGTQHNFAVNNWGNSDGDYWMFGSNIEGNSGGSWSKPSTTTRSAGIVVDGRMGRTILLSSQTSTSTIDEHFTFDNSGVFHINKNGGGVSFAANTDNGGTSSATLMDDYEEGSYSSTIVSSNCTLDNSSATGYYIKVGNLVQVRGTFRMNTNDGSPSASGSDNIIQSLPYTPVGNGTYTGTMLQQNWNWGGPTTSSHPHWFNPLVADYVCLAASDGIRFYMNRIEYSYQRMNNSHLHVGYPGYTAIYWSIMYQTT